MQVGADVSKRPEHPGKFDEAHQDDDARPWRAQYSGVVGDKAVTLLGWRVARMRDWIAQQFVEQADGRDREQGRRE